MPIYRVDATVGETVLTRLVEAPNEAQALRHAAKKHLKAEAIRSSEQIKDMAALAAKGLQVETAESE